MMRMLAVLMLVLIAALGVQSWRLSTAHNKIDAQVKELAAQGKKLSQKNGQLIALNILTQSSSRAQTQLYATAEQNGTLLRDRQRTIEELKRENDELRHWADANLPDPVIRLHQRPALTGGQSYREWLSANHPVPPGRSRTAP
ncbi:Rz-like lysis system protein LysB [Pantoea dispersa]|uniref:Rz-like lysis system protein LysB n=1 Tax=Pantoea dispersa TaxID=59814 RepID=UPI00241D39BA|nr:Rz-like lysis system protein LysB [Pantoea dispersa]MDI9768706.1 Rz-like lysis system protein LysB [Pantoea dispersa]